MSCFLPAALGAAAMAGDVNLYWNDCEEANTAEIEVMVAEPRSRRKGAAEEALRLLQAYAAAHLVRRTGIAAVGGRGCAANVV